MAWIPTGNQLSKKTYDKAIVFIHGLNGSKDTWTGTSQRFLNRMKADKGIYDNFALFIFEYPTTIVDFALLKKLISIIPGLGINKSKFNDGIRNIAGELITDIQVHLKDYNDIILITHSMGGLVAKRAMVGMTENQLKKIKLYYSISVPHLGSGFAKIGSALIGRRNPQLKNLQTFGEFTTELTQTYAGLPHFPKTIYHWGSQDIVVPEASAIPSGVNVSYIIKTSFDHYNVLLIPTTSSHTVYKSIKDELDIILLLSLQKSLSHSANAVVNFTIIDNWTFRISALGLASSADCTIEFKGFSPIELDTPLSGQNLTKTNTFQALEHLKHTGKAIIPDYNIDLQGSHFIITKKP